MSATMNIAEELDMHSAVHKVFAEVTRYPEDILDSEASLEEDLGIDSVKLGEVFSVLRERFNLPETMDLPREQLRSISGVSSALEAFLAGKIGGGDAKGAAAPNDAEPLNGGEASPKNGSESPAAPEDLGAAVMEVFADVTRYPSDILDPDASLEEDLGIDSVKLGEVFSVLRERFDLPEQMDLPREQMNSISGITTALGTFIGSRNGNGSSKQDGGHQGNGNGSGSPAAAAPPPAHEVASPLNGGNGSGVKASEVGNEVMEIFQEVTRYPAEILDGDALLEEDLGVDSVKLGEVFSVLRERYDLPETMDLPREQLRTINGVAAALAAYISPAKSAAAPEPELEPVSPRNGNGAKPGHASLTPPARDLGGRLMDQSFAGLTPEQKPFEGKVAFITGSGRGIGKAIGSYLGQLGATVIMNSFHSRDRGEAAAEEIKAAGGKAAHYWGSVANPEQLDAMFDRIESDYGKLDFFISNASNGMLARLEDITTEDWEKAFRTNIIGLHQSSMRAAGIMKKNGGGKIITMSSPAAHGYVDYFGCMGAVKAAVESLTRSLAVELSPHNIQVNCVSPGPVYGELLNKWPESERLIPQWEENTAYERLCEPEDVAHFVAYLLSEPVKLFTGSVLIMDGGISSQGW